MLVGLFKFLLLYMAFVFVKNAVKGYLAYQGLKRQAQGKAKAQAGKKTSSGSQKSDVFEAEYRVLRDE